MTQPDHPVETKMSATALPTSLDDILLYVIGTLLAPMFLMVGGNFEAAQIAARQTMNAYRTQNDPDLIAAALVVACGLAAIDSLSLSMAGEDLSLAMILRLRGNAVALNRAAELNRQAIGKLGRGRPRATAQQRDPEEAQLIANIAATEQRAAELNALFAANTPPSALGPVPSSTVPAAYPGTPAQLTPAQLTPAERTPAERTPPTPHETRSQPQTASTIRNPQPPANHGAPPTDQTLTDWQRQATWGSAAAKIAAEYVTDLNELPPEERGSAALRAAALNSAANELLAGEGPSSCQAPYQTPYQTPYQAPYQTR